MYKILLVGAGEIGSRYLQGLTKLKNDFEIIVIEPNSERLKTAKSRWTSACVEGKNYDIKWFNKIQLPKYKIDLAIIATSSANRSNIMNDVLETFSPKFWIIEKLLAQSKNDIDAIIDITDKAIGAWVNAGLRTDRWYREIFLNNDIKGPLKIIKNGGLWDMACNSIHFIDLVSWWTDEKLLSIDTSNLSKNWTKSKRSGYFEITGEMICKYSKGSELILKSFDGNAVDYIKIIMDENKEVLINENEEFVISTDGIRSNGRPDFLSESINLVIDKLIVKNVCDLPTVKMSSLQHKVFIETMLNHWNFSKNLKNTEVPIT